jgi:hypothetical protein
VKWIRFPFLVFAVLIFVVMAGLFASLNTPWAKDQLEKAVRKNCEGCSFTIKSAALTWRGLVIKDIYFATGRKGAKKLEVQVARAVIRPEIWPLLKKEIHIRSVALFYPQITYSEGDAITPRSREKDSGFDLELDKIVIYDGQFVYVRDHKGTHAVLTVNDIRGRMSFEGERMTAGFHARMGRSGKFVLTGQAGLKKPLEVETELRVRDQDLADLTVFLKPNAGVELKGQIVNAVARSRAHGDKLNTRLNITFKDFTLKLHEMYDRSDVRAFFTTIGAALALKTENVKALESEKSSTVDTQREKGESVVHFLLTGLKEASLEVAK